jgi:ribosome-binding factor A
MVTVTGAEVTRDLRHAKIFVSVYGDEAKREETFVGLRSLATHLRSVVGRNLNLRSAPEIEFVADESIARASRIDALLEEVRNAGNPGGEDVAS